VSELKKHERAAIEAVAKRFAATWEKGENPPDAYLIAAGKRIAVEVTAIKQRIAGHGHPARPRLRFDRVALGFVAGLQGVFRGSVPDGKTVILTITAPIKLASKTAKALEDRIRIHLARRSAPPDLRDTIHGNQIRVRIAKGGSGGRKVIGFVHNPDSHPDLLLNITCSLSERIGAEAAKRAPAQFAGDRWLIIATAGEPSHVETYRHVYSQLSIPTGFNRILMVFPDGRVEALNG
jgi:hypothetical protein